MRFAGKSGAGAAMTTLALALVPTAAARAPSDPDCLPLVAGSTGVPLLGGSVPTRATVTGTRGGFGEPASAEVARTLPDVVAFKSQTETFGRDYAFALRGGRLYVRRATVGRGDPAEPWHRLELPACLDGHVKEISADDSQLLALGRERQLYSHSMPGGDLSPERWTWRWGPYFWTGTGLRMWDDVRTWATSEFNGDERFTDTSGREQAPIGVLTVYLLRSDSRRITYIDPWLPNDESREVCGPRRGTTRIAGLSGSGSTVFVASERGELWTRLYDFDVSGANTVFGDYSWQTDRPADDARWQLPGPEWLRHARPRRGRITDRISIAKTGVHARDRLLRVEGRDRRGRRGWWEKPLAAPGHRAWRFVATGAPLRGRPLPLRTPVARPAPDDRRYAGAIAGAPAEVRNFNPECSPATLRVEIAPGLPLDLILHSSDGLRQEVRARGLDGEPREYNGAIEVPRAAFDDRRFRPWIDAHLGGRRIATAPLAVTSTGIRFLAQCWTLTVNGGPARPGSVRVPPDLGAAFGRLTEQQKDDRTPGKC